MDVFSKEKQPWERRVFLTRKVYVATMELLSLSLPHHCALTALYVQRKKKNTSMKLLSLFINIPDI